MLGLLVLIDIADEPKLNFLKDYKIIKIIAKRTVFFEHTFW